MLTLLISVRFYEGRYHGDGDWPPSPARLFQALVAGAARGATLSGPATEAFKWLENLGAPAIAAPSAYAGQRFKSFVPNNDLDAVGGDPSRMDKIRTAKTIQPRMFNASVPVVYVWTFERGADAVHHARTICEIADSLYQLGRGFDMAWAQSEIVDESEAGSRLRESVSISWRPTGGGGGTALPCPDLGSLESLAQRFRAQRARFRSIGQDKKEHLLFSQAPKPSFRQVPYNSPSTYLLLDIRKADAFAPQSMDRVVTFTEKLRDFAVERLKDSDWRRDDPERQACIEKIFVGRDSTGIDRARRIRITPLPSIGYEHTERSIRRVLVAVPPECPIATDDIAWTFSGLVLASDQNTGEILHELVLANDRRMLSHYGIEDAAPARLWRTITPVALPHSTTRTRIDAGRMREEAKCGAERLREQAAAAWAVRQALRHAGIGSSVHAIRVQREPFEANGQRAEAFAVGSRFTKERLWHVEIAFGALVEGPLLIGDGRFLGLGLMAPVSGMDSGVHAFVVVEGLYGEPQPLDVVRALRRAVMARVQNVVGKRAKLAPFFSGHEEDGTPLRGVHSSHLAFAFEPVLQRLLVLAPHLLERRSPTEQERDHLRTLDDALEGFRELRAGNAGRLSISPSVISAEHDDSPLGRSRVWETMTPYVVTRHAKARSASEALATDVCAECRRLRLPDPRVEPRNVRGVPDTGLVADVRLTFGQAVSGPILLGRTRYFGGGLFRPIRQQRE